jgi:hypothetical protein
MSCERIREQIPECLSGNLDKAARERLVEHLEGCAGCRGEVAELNAVWRAMDGLSREYPEAPDPAAKARFLQVLDAYRAGMGAAVEMPRRTSRTWFGAHPVWQTAMAGGLLIAGVFAGRSMSQPKGDSDVAQLKGQVESLRQLVALSMLQQDSAGARLRGVSYSEQMSQPDRQVQQALLFAVNHDSNVNVRLSAVDALQKYAADPEVARAMADAIPVQDSPLVQVALIDMLVQVKAAGTAPAMARLAVNKDADQAVRQRAAAALQTLGGGK